MTASEVSPSVTTEASLRIRAVRPVPDRLIVAALIVVAVALRAPNLGRSFWVDEGISVGIASHRLTAVPGLLRHDGSPPLFYFVLHFWIRLFGSSEPATHALPLILSLAAIPVGYWAGRQVFSRPAGIAAAALLATNPFLNWYATETRMYTLVVLLSLVAVTLAWRAVRDRQPADGVGAVLAFAALLYTHNWSVYLAGATGLMLLRLTWARGDRQMLGWVLAGGAATVALWLPWLPSFLYQAGNTAAPWAVRPGMGDFFADPSTALAGTLGFVVVPLLVLGVWLARGRISPDHRLAASVIGGMAFLATAAGFVGAEMEPSWTVRYLAIIVGPYLLAAAGALAGTGTGRKVLWAACLLVGAWALVGLVLPNSNARYAKSNVAAVTGAVASRMKPGDVVLVTQTEQLSVVHHYLPGGLGYLTPTGPVGDPSVVDWRNIVSRLQRADPCAALAPTIDALPVGAAVLEINPVRSLGANGSAWSRAVNGQVTADDSFLARDPALTPVGLYTPGLSPKPFSPVDAVLYLKTTAARACG